MDSLILLLVAFVITFAVAEFTSWRVRRSLAMEFEKERGDIWQDAYEQGINDERLAAMNPTGNWEQPNRGNPYRKR